MFGEFLLKEDRGPFLPVVYDELDLVGEEPAVDFFGEVRVVDFFGEIPAHCLPLFLLRWI